MRAILPLMAIFAVGCYPCGGGDCGAPDPIRSELLIVDLYEDTVAEDLERIDITIQGDLEILDDSVVLTYADVDGNVFQVTWDR